MYLFIAGKEEAERSEALESANLEYDYVNRERAYRIKISALKDYQANRTLLEEMIVGAMEYI